MSSNGQPSQDVAILANRLGKRFHIGATQDGYRTLRDSLAAAALAPVRGVRHLLHRNGRLPADKTTIWALKDVSFEIARGEVVGVIGRNGAGKSTLLKILSRITEPTEGEAEIRGRVGSLLEVGTGFHPELTGRENIYLNGAILGMRHAEIDRKFDEMVAFAEVERFIDTPVKHYSSGMYLRLAFAVAAHLEPEILLVDEVLAVGDARFQNRCLGKMREIASQGRTVLFISHNMQAVARLCSRTLLLDAGRLQMYGPTSDVVTSYLHSGHGLLAERTWTDLNEAPGTDVVRLTTARTRNHAGISQQVFNSREPIGIDIGYEVLKPVKDLAAEVAIYNPEGVLLFISINQYDEQLLACQEPGAYLSTCWIPADLMTEESFFVQVNLNQLQTPMTKHVTERDLLAFQVIDPAQGNSARGRVMGSYKGVIRPKLNWTTQCASLSR
jgi:lipopolysaccharide transport system ATP-binding protein